MPVWNALNLLQGYLATLPKSILGEVSPRANIGPDVHIEAGAIVEAGATIQGAAWIGAGTIIRSGAYVRQNVVVGRNCILGNSCEFKNCLLFDHCEVPHFNYVGDAILGYKAHLGAGVILSNVRLDRQMVRFKNQHQVTCTGLNKFSAIIGDHAEIGCNSVISPGSFIGRHSIIYPGAQFAGILPERSILKIRQQQEIVKRV